MVDSNGYTQQHPDKKNVKAEKLGGSHWKLKDKNVTEVNQI